MAEQSLSVFKCCGVTGTLGTQVVFRESFLNFGLDQEPFVRSTSNPSSPHVQLIRR
jgi:hypothetical protein